MRDPGYQMIALAVALLTIPCVAAADHRGATVAELFTGAEMTPEVFDACSLGPGNDPVHHTEMDADCQAVFEPCHVRLHLPSPLEYPDNQYAFEDATALEQCLSREAERYLVLLDLSNAERLVQMTGATDVSAQSSAGAGWLVALNYQSSARAGALCSRDYDGSSLLGYLQCLNDAWTGMVHETRTLLQEGN